MTKKYDSLRARHRAQGEKLKREMNDEFAVVGSRLAFWGKRIAIGVVAGLIATKTIQYFLEQNEEEEEPEKAKDFQELSDKVREGYYPVVIKEPTRSSMLYRRIRENMILFLVGLLREKLVDLVHNLSDNEDAE